MPSSSPGSTRRMSRRWIRLFPAKRAQGTIMRNLVEIEDIEKLRMENGIDDVELRDAIRGLSAGDIVKVTILCASPASPAETVSVRITRIRGNTFSGTLATRPATAKRLKLRVGEPLVFHPEHIHSIAKRLQNHEH